MPDLVTLTNSALSKLRVCEEEYRLAQVERLEPPDRVDHFGIGSAVHRGIEMGSPYAAGDYLHEEWGKPWNDAEETRLAIGVATVEAMTAAALRRWDDWPDVSLREHKFRLPLINPATGHASTRHDLGGMTDGLWESLPLSIQMRHAPSPPNGPAILEIKTTARLDGDYLAAFRLDVQPTTYMEAVGREKGITIRTGVYRFIRKPGIRRRNPETALEFDLRCQRRKPLPDLKGRTLAKVPKGVTVDGVGALRKLLHRDAIFVEGSRGGWSETVGSLANRNRAREDAREPLTRREGETVPEFCDRIRGVYLSDPDKYLHEEVITRSDQDVRRWQAETWEAHLRVLRIERGGMTIRNPRACLSGRRCDYFDLCTGAVEVESFNRRTHLNPELEP